jgi:hypothetical protein
MSTKAKTSSGFAKDEKPFEAFPYIISSHMFFKDQTVG